MAQVHSLVSSILIIKCRDPVYSNFDMNYFLTGTDSGGEEQDTIRLNRLRLPRITSGQKSVIDYTKLDRHTHGKLEVLTIIPHEGEVLKVRACP